MFLNPRAATPTTAATPDVAAKVAALLLGVVVELAVSPRYRAASQILIGPVDLRLVGEKSVMPAAQSSDANVLQVESETRILTSDRVLRRVVEREQLTADPEFQMRGGSLLGGAVSALRVAIGLRPEPAKTVDREIDAIRLLQRNVSAKRTERTYVIDLIVETTDPEKSARIANAIGMAYLDEQSDARAEAARRATDSLSSRLSEQRDRVRQAEEQVELYKAQHSIVGPKGRFVDEQQLTELNNQLTAARARTAEAGARYEQTVQLRRAGTDRGSTLEAIQSSTLGRLREQYGTIALQEANLAAELGPRHPRVIEARAQLRTAQQQITDEISRIAETNRSDYDRALANEKTLEQNLNTLKQRAMDTGLAFVKLRELEREVEASRAVYESFLVRAREIREQERLDTANVRILSDAQAPQDRSWPPRRLQLLLALLVLGILGGGGLAYLAELRTRRARMILAAGHPNEHTN
jgi:succinoglycan biosynthesis transport protein ExoP